MALLLHNFHRWYQGSPLEDEDEEEAAKGALRSFQTALNRQDLRVSNNDYDDIFIDLLMYNNRSLSHGPQRPHEPSSSLNSALSNLKDAAIGEYKERAAIREAGQALVNAQREIDTHDIWGRLATDEHKHISAEAHRALIEIKHTIVRRREV